MKKPDGPELACHRAELIPSSNEIGKWGGALRAPPQKGGGALRAPPPFAGSYYAGAAADATGVAVAAAGARDGDQILDVSKVLHDGSIFSLSYSNKVD